MIRQQMIVEGRSKGQRLPHSMLSIIQIFKARCKTRGNFPKKVGVELWVFGWVCMWHRMHLIHTPSSYACQHHPIARCVLVSHESKPNFSQREVYHTEGYIVSNRGKERTIYAAIHDTGFTLTFLSR